MLLKLGRDQDYVRIRYSCHGPRLLRQLNDTKFYRRLDTDITSDIQTRVEFFTKRLHKDGVIDYKTKQFLIQTDPKPGRFYIL